MSGISGINFNNSYFGTTSSGVSTLFGNLSTSSSSNTTSILSDYASIKNGSYGKLLKSYYAKLDSEDSSSAKPTDSNSRIQTLTERDSAKALKESAKALYDSEELFEKKEIKDKDGKVTMDYDTDAIYKAVSDFVKDYNSTVEAVGDSSNTSVLNTGSNMVSLTSAMAKSLSKVGITVGSGNKLTIDEETFKSADMNNIKTLFEGSGSFAYRVGSSASSIVNSAASQIANLSGSIYNGTGAYGSSYAYSGSLYTSNF